MLLNRESLKDVIREEIARRARAEAAAVDEEVTATKPAKITSADKTTEPTKPGGGFEAKGQQAALVNRLMDRISKNQLISGFMDELSAEPGSDKALVALAAFTSMLLGGGDIKDVYQKVSRFQKMQKKVSK